MKPGSSEGVGFKGPASMSEARKGDWAAVRSGRSYGQACRAALEFGAGHALDRCVARAIRSVQEIADVEKGTDITVLVKNPMTPDLDLWVGAVTRIRNAASKTSG